MSTSDTMKAWQLNSFGNDLSSHLQLNTEAPIPEISQPDEILIKVHATSINPIDTFMVRGYGSKAIQILREKAKGRWTLSVLCNRGEEFPITLGRDIAGTVERIGKDVTEFKVGDKVYGFVLITHKGSHAEYAVVNKNWIHLKPDFLKFREAASITFGALTTWSVIRNAGLTDLKDKNFLVLGGSGGVGTVAIQYLKSAGAKITTTCSAASFSALTELGADFVVDYKSDDVEKEVESHGPYDCILDLSGGLEKSANFMKFGRRGHCQFILLNFHGIHNLDNYGLVFGGIKTGWDLASLNVNSKLRYGVTIRWGMFTPHLDGFKEIVDLVQQKKIKPNVEQVYKFSEMQQAYERVNKGHLRGKIVVEIIEDK